MPTLVDPNHAPNSAQPELLGDRTISFERVTPQTYKAEAWLLANGERFAIVSDNGGESLESIALEMTAKCNDLWASDGQELQIIDHYEDGSTHRYRWHGRARREGLKEDELTTLRSKGLALP